MRRKILSALCLALLLGCSYVHAEDESERPNLAKMRVKQLREILSERGVNTAGIMEKGDLVKLAEESYDLPIVATPPKPVVKDEKPDKPMSNEDLDDVLSKLQAETGQGFKVFRPGDDMDSFMSGMKNEYDGGGKSKPKRKGKKTNKDDL